MKQASAAKNKLKILESRRDRQTQSVQEEVGERSDQKLIDTECQITCCTKRAALRVDSKDQELANRAHEIKQEVKKAAQRNVSKLRKLQRRFDHLQSRSKLRSNTRVHHCGLQTAMGPPGVPCEVATLDKRNPPEVITSQGSLDQGTALGGVPRTSPRQGWNCPGNRTSRLLSWREEQFLFQVRNWCCWNH